MSTSQIQRHTRFQHTATAKAYGARHTLTCASPTPYLIPQSTVISYIARSSDRLTFMRSKLNGMPLTCSPRHCPARIQSAIWKSSFSVDTSYKRGRTKVSIGRARCTSLNPDRFPHIFRETGWGSLCSLLSHRRSRSQRRPPSSVVTPESSATTCRHSIVFLLPVHSTGWFFTFVLSLFFFRKRVWSNERSAFGCNTKPLAFVLALAGPEEPLCDSSTSKFKLSMFPRLHL